MWISRASRGRLSVPLSCSDVRGMEGLMVGGALVVAVADVGTAAAVVDAAAAGSGCEVGEEEAWPLV